MRHVSVESIDAWRHVLTGWAIGGDRGPYNATNFAGLFERYDAEVNSRRIKSMTPAPAYSNGKQTTDKLAEALRMISAKEGNHA